MLGSGGRWGGGGGVSSHCQIVTRSISKLFPLCGVTGLLRRLTLGEVSDESIEVRGVFRNHRRRESFVVLLFPSVKTHLRDHRIYCNDSAKSSK